MKIKGKRWAARNFHERSPWRPDRRSAEAKEPGLFD